MTQVELNPPAAVARVAMSRPESILFFVVIALQISLIWSYRYIPTADGPAHVDNCSILRNYYATDATTYRQYYVLRKSPDPNLGGHLVMAGLMFVVPPLIAEKLLLSAYILLLPLAFRYALGSMRPGARPLAFLIFPFTFNYIFHMGFYNFSTSIVVFFFVVGYWLKHRENFGVYNAVKLGLLMLLLYTCHIFSLTMAWVFIAAVGAWFILWDALQLRRLDWKLLWPGIRSRWVVPGIACLPALALWKWFLRKGLVPAKAWDAGRVEQLKRLVKFDYFVSYKDVETWFYVGLGLLLVFAGVWVMVRQVREKRCEIWDGLLVAMFAFLVLFLTLGTQFYMAYRVNLYVMMALIFWVAVAVREPILTRVLQVGSVTVALLLLASHFISYKPLNAQTEELVAAREFVSPNSTLLPISFAPTDLMPATIGSLPTSSHFFSPAPTSPPVATS